MGLLERWEDSTLLLLDLLHGEDCALQLQFSCCSFQLEAGQSLWFQNSFLFLATLCSVPQQV